MKKSIISLFAIIFAFSNVMLGRMEDCVNINGRTICASNFSHDDLVVVKNYLKEDEEDEDEEAIQAEMAFKGEKLAALMQKVSNDIKPEAQAILDEILNQNTEDIAITLSYGSFEKAYQEYLTAQVIYENLSLFRAKLPFGTKSYDNQKVKDAYRDFEVRMANIFYANLLNHEKADEAKKEVIRNIKNIK